MYASSQRPIARATRQSAIEVCVRTYSIGSLYRQGIATRSTTLNYWRMHFWRGSIEYGTAKRLDPRRAGSCPDAHMAGNVCELKNCVERSYVLSDGLEAFVHPVLDIASNVLDPHDGVRVPIGTTMADAERDLLLATLRHCGGNKRRTADMLGVSLKTVYNKLVGYGIAATLLRAAGEG
jgi:DNA-binding protein Fis